MNIGQRPITRQQSSKTYPISGKYTDHNGEPLPQRTPTGPQRLEDVVTIGCSEETTESPTQHRFEHL